MNKLILIFVLLLPFSAFSEIQIVTSITPLSSLAAMIIGDKGTISTIASNQGCPHHYSLKPSDLAKVENADLFIYIDKNFDVFATNLLTKFHKQQLEISKLSDINISNQNFHLWLLPENAIAILKAITDSLIAISPENKPYFETRLNTNIKRMKDLAKARNQISTIANHIILLSDSAEYVFLKLNVEKIYELSEYSSLKSTKKLKELAEDGNKCFIISSDQSLEKYNKLLGPRVISLATENWEETSNLSELYYIEYAKIMSNITQGCR